jgi:hypothetical protein
VIIVALTTAYIVRERYINERGKHTEQIGYLTMFTEGVLIHPGNQTKAIDILHSLGLITSR